MPDPRTALITGASSGIGAAFARELAKQGYSLILSARREEKLSALADELKERHGTSSLILLADLATDEGVAKLETAITDTPLDLLINNAGFGVEGTFLSADLGRQVDMIHVHVLATVRLTRAALPGMIERGRGGVINVSSIAAFLARAETVTYCATKAYLNTFSKALAEELRGTGVQVQALCPGFTHTDFHDRPELPNFEKGSYPDWVWMSAEAVAQQSLEALERGKVIFVPGRLNKVLALLASNPPLAPLLGLLERGAVSSKT